MASRSGIMAIRIGGLGAVLVLAFGLVLGCQSQPTGPAAAPTQAAVAPTKPAAMATAAPAAQAPATQPAATAAPETLKVGVSSGLSGPGAKTGLNVTRWIELGIDEVNAAGGVKVGGKTYRLESITTDDKFTSDGGREAANKLVLADKVRFVLGIAGGAVAGAQAITEPSKVLILAGGANDQALGKAFPSTLVFGSPHDLARMDVLFNWLAQERPDLKRVAVVLADDQTGRMQMDMADAAAKTRGLTLVAKEYYPLDTKDFAPLVTRVLREKPDAVESPTGSRGAMFLQLVQALREQGFKGLVFGTTGDSSMTQGLPHLEGFTAVTLMDVNAPVVPSKVKDVVQRYVQKYGERDIDIAGVATFNIAPIFAQSMEKAGTVDNTEAIAKVLREGEWETIWSKELGKSRFDGTQRFGLPVLLQQPLYLSKVEKGKAVTFKAVMSRVP